MVLAAILGSLVGERSADYFLRRPSTFFTDESGARALLLVMKRLLPSAEQWRRPLSLLELPAEPAAPSTLIVAGPGRPISESEAEYLDRWLADGGQLILATDNGWPIIRRKRAIDEQEPEKAFPEASNKDREDAETIAPGETFLSSHLPGIRWSKPDKIHNERITGALVPDGGINFQMRRKFSTADGARVIAAAGTAALAVEVPVGSGRIVALADSTVVSNRALREADNAVLLITLAGGWRNGKVLVDEYHHGFGQQRSAAALTWAFMKTPWGWCVLQIAAAGLLYAFGYRRRFGRISEPPPSERSSPLELVEARAGVFQAAAAQNLATEMIVQNLSQELARAYDKPVNISDLNQQPQGAIKSALSAERRAIFRDLSGKAARGEKLTDREFIEVGRIAGEMTQGPVS
jgi:hypothetical protein